MAKRAHASNFGVHGLYQNRWRSTVAFRFPWTDGFSGCRCQWPPSATGSPGFRSFSLAPPPFLILSTVFLFHPNVLHPQKSAQTEYPGWHAQQDMDGLPPRLSLSPPRKIYIDELSQNDGYGHGMCVMGCWRSPRKMSLPLPLLQLVERRTHILRYSGSATCIVQMKWQFRWFFTLYFCMYVSLLVSKWWWVAR